MQLFIYFCSIIVFPTQLPRYRHGIGIVLLVIYQSLINHLYAILHPYIYKDIWHIIEKNMNMILQAIRCQYRANTVAIRI